MNSDGTPHRPQTITSNRRPGRARWHAASLGALGLLLVSGCAFFGDDDTTSPNDPAFPPLAVLVPADKVMRSAEQFAKQHPAAFVFIADGDETLPRYASGTALVVEPGHYHALRRGTTVVLRTPDNGPVVRVLVAKTAAGWMARGFKSPSDDLRAMTEETYLGTVIMVFTPRT